MPATRPGFSPHWALRTEPDPALAEAWRAIARSAQLRAAEVPGTLAAARFPPSQNTAQLLLRAATRSASERGRLLSQITGR